MNLWLFRFFYFCRVVVPAMFFMLVIGGVLWYGIFGPSETCTETNDGWTICRIH